MSSEHAIVRWFQERWELRDLGSRNGTFVDGRRLDAGERALLHEGAVFTLGGLAMGFTLVGAGAPLLLARQRKTGQTQTATDHVLALPDDAHPRALVFQDAAGQWVVEREDEAPQPVVDHELLIVDGQTWVVELPAGAPATWVGLVDTALETVAMRFVVSRDEEHVEVTVLRGGHPILLAPRSYHYLLLTLARQRLKDAELPPIECGWIDRGALCKMLAVDPLKLNVDVSRARKQLGDAGIRGAAGLIERRPTTGQLRLGVARVEVVSP
ncbi:FHA domain protein [Chondromyces apiculatus DSM 436]|uniref:FHA domain protein n=1 Tax=Chondromyces apiculatus DSM 436 TaxID=1192034 RepID=A0A017T2J8_9BACT|nr:FHA domain protein [Chondromyces apiculatus DSM 436]